MTGALAWEINNRHWAERRGALKNSNIMRYVARNQLKLGRIDQPMHGLAASAAFDRFSTTVRQSLKRTGSRNDVSEPDRKPVIMCAGYSSRQYNILRECAASRPLLLRALLAAHQGRSRHKAPILMSAWHSRGRASWHGEANEAIGRWHEMVMGNGANAHHER